MTAQDLPGILNWRRLSPRVTTSGQPTEAQLAEIRDLGVTHVINLGPHDNKGALADEAGTVAALGMTYIYLPVDFENPTDRDFEDFRTAMGGLPGAKVHVHCIYNARVSAFFYRYAKSGSELSEADARANMESIWRPGADWAAFIGSAEARGQPNRYAGEDY
ncbi:MAG: protein tyrosine phosphatase family protein [Pseudomonadota bacterium]